MKSPTDTTRETIPIPKLTQDQMDYIARLCRERITPEMLQAAWIKAKADGAQLIREATPDRDTLNQPCTI